MSSAWPKVCELVGTTGSLVLELAPRAISVDLAEAAEEVELAASLVGERGPNGSIAWYIGSLRDVIAKAAPSAQPEEALQSYRSGAVSNVLLQKGNTFRCYNVKNGNATATGSGAKPPASLAKDPRAGADGEVEGQGYVEPHGGGTTGRRAREKYSQAIAYEFVSGVMDNILAIHEEQTLAGGGAVE
jgi:hypothetical protein